MPVYESAPVVFEIGSAYTKIGFASEPYPRAIIPTENYDVNTGSYTNVFNNNNNEQKLYDHMVTFIEKIFFEHALVSPKERKIVIVESVYCPTTIRNTLAKVLFRHFEVLSIFFVPLHLVVLATIAVDTALVVDIGHLEANVIPVYCGVQINYAYDAQPLASQAVHNEIRRQLIAENINTDLLTDRIIEDIKVRLCFVTTYERAQQYRNNLPPTPCPDCDYPIIGKQIIKINGRLRETAFEVLFPDDNDNLSLPNIILNAILRCPIDTRKQLIENILLIGGTAMTMGLQARLKSELLTLMQSNQYNETLFVKGHQVVKFHSAPAKPNFTAWLGGSIYGGTKLTHTRCLTKESFAKNNRVPDWINFLDNCSPINEQ